MPCFLALLHDPHKGHSLLRPSFANWWEGIGSVLSGHSVVAKPPQSEGLDWARPLPPSLTLSRGRPSAPEAGGSSSCAT